MRVEPEMSSGPTRPIARVSVRSRRKKWQGFSLSMLQTAFLVVSLISTLWILLIFTGSAFIPSPLLLHSNSLPRPRKFLERKPENPSLGFFGELMISFLREDLPFTIFVPSASSFQSMFQTMHREAANVSDSGANNTYMVSDLKLSNGAYAVLSRLFGFCAIPRRILSGMVPVHGEIAFESVSGYRLHLSRHARGALRVNNLVSTKIDMTRGSIVVHIIDGVIMDAEFEQSLMPFSDGFDKEQEVH